MNAWIPVVSLVVGAVLLWAGDLVKQWVDRRDARSLLKMDVELYRSLPDDFASRADLKANIEARIRETMALPTSPWPAVSADLKRLANRLKFGVSLYVLGVPAVVYSWSPFSDYLPNLARIGIFLVGFVGLFAGVLITIGARNARTHLVESIRLRAAIENSHH